MQKTFLTGIIGNNVETKTGKDGNMFYVTSIAVKGAMDKTEWYNVTINGDNKIAPYIKKGYKVLLEGKVSAGCYMKDGQPVAKLTISAYGIELFSSKAEQSDGNNYVAKGKEPITPDDSTIPF